MNYLRRQIDPLVTGFVIGGALLVTLALMGWAVIN